MAHSVPGFICHTRQEKSKKLVFIVFISGSIIGSCYYIVYCYIYLNDQFVMRCFLAIQINYNEMKNNYFNS